MKKILIVKFKQGNEALVPGLGEKGGLNNDRISGGNETPVVHDMTFDEEAQILTITHLTMPHLHPESMIPIGNIRWMQACRPPSPSVAKEPSENAAASTTPPGIAKCAADAPPEEPIKRKPGRPPKASYHSSTDDE